MGALRWQKLAELACERGSYVHVWPTSQRRDLRDFLAAASLLVSLPQDSDLAMRSKMFEYLTYDAGMLALARSDSATALALQGTAADVVAPDDVDGIAAVLASHFESFDAGRHPRRVVAHTRLSRRAQATVLFDAFERILASAPKPLRAQAAM